MNKGLLLLSLLYFAATTSAIAQITTNKPVVIGYVGGYRGRIINTDAIAADKLTHINYAFGNVEHNRVILSRERTDTVNLKNLVLLRKRNPALKILISLGGWTWSGNFSDAVLTDTSRKAFAISAVALLTRFDLDGIDIDWEYPGMAGSGHIYRDEDKHNYTLMFAELRKQLDATSIKLKRKLLLTTAVGAFKRFLIHTEMGKAAQYLDYINLMTYDYFGDGKLGRHHTNLYTSGNDQSEDSADKAFMAFTAAGVPASKLVMGIAFYGRLFQLKPNTTHALRDSIASYMRGRDYSFIKDSLINQNGFMMYRDTIAKAPYLFNNTTMQFLTYDDDWSVQAKCQYVLDKKMAGVMFWEYDSDPGNNLLNTINISFK